MTPEEARTILNDLYFSVKYGRDHPNTVDEICEAIIEAIYVLRKEIK